MDVHKSEKVSDIVEENLEDTTSDETKLKKIEKPQLEIN